MDRKQILNCHVAELELEHDAGSDTDIEYMEQELKHAVGSQPDMDPMNTVRQAPMTVALEVDSGPLACAIRILRKRSHSEISVENLASSSSSSHTQASATEIIKKTPASSSCSVKSVTNATPDITFSSCASVVASDRIPAIL